MLDPGSSCRPTHGSSETRQDHQYVLSSHFPGWYHCSGICRRQRCPWTAHEVTCQRMESAQCTSKRHLSWVHRYGYVSIFLITLPVCLSFARSIFDFKVGTRQQGIVSFVHTTSSATFPDLNSTFSSFIHVSGDPTSWSNVSWKCSCFRPRLPKNIRIV